MISADTIDAVKAAVGVDASVAALRSRFPGLHFTECSEDDVSPRAKPVADMDAHILYLVTGASGHCLALTNDFDLATGIVVAAKVDED